jgi:class 3 adenylate cyclase
MEQKDYRLAAIMYTDIAGFSRMMEKDEAGTLELLRFHNDLIGGIVAAHHGTVIKTIGDALLVDFKNTVEAMQSAMEIQDKLYAHNKENPGLPLLVRIGVHLGDIYFFENDALGEGINIAARLQSLASPGCICFSGDVYNLVLNKIEFRAEKLGKVSLKNITKEIHAYEITTPNVEFDPNRGKPRPGFKPGSYLDGAPEEAEDQGGPGAETENYTLSHAPTRSPFVTTTPPAQGGQAPRAAERVLPLPPAQAAPPLPPAAEAEPLLAGGKHAEADRSYSPEDSRRILDEIRKAILQDIKNEGRRLSVEETLKRYGAYGVEAKEVIASMAESGLLVKRGGGDRPGEGRPGEGRPGFQGPGNFGFDPEAIGRNIEAAVHGIVGEIERSVERNMSRQEGQGYGYDHAAEYERLRERHQRRAERHAARDALRTMGGDLPTGKWDRKLGENDDWSTIKEEQSPSMEPYREQLIAKARRQRGGLIGHFTSYIAVNAGLWYLNMGVAGGPHGFPWALIVSAAWGIGLVSSLVAARRGAAKANEVQSMPELDNGQLLVYKKLNRVRDSMAMHTASTITVPLLLGIINLSYAGGSNFLWFLIPTAAMFVGWISHLGAYGASKAKLQRQLLSSLGVEGGWRNIFKFRKAQKATTSELGPFAAQYQDAERAKAAILAEIKTGTPLDTDLAPSLDAFVGQVRLLAQSANEIDRIVGGIPMADLEKDKAELVRKSDASTAASLKDEYKRSIAEIEKQEQSYEELKNQSEVIKLRLSSSVNQLKQMRIDVARLKAAGDEGAGGVTELKRRTEELSSYLQDLRKGYDEGAADPFAELEELAKANDERKRLEDETRKKD